MRIIAPVAIVAGLIAASIGISILRETPAPDPGRSVISGIVLQADVASSVLGSGGGRNDVADHLSRIGEGCAASGDEKLARYGAALADAKPLATGALLSRIAVTAREVEAARLQAGVEAARSTQALWGYGLLALGGLMVFGAAVERGRRSELLEREADRIRNVASRSPAGPERDVVMLILREQSMRDRAIRESLELLSDRAVIAAALDSLEAQSKVCAMTGLLNRDTFIALGGERIAELVAGGPQLGLVYCDLDYFRAVNTTYGHAEGDRAILHFADLLRHVSDDRFLVAHPHGDEFVVAVPGDREVVTAFLEKLREFASESPFHTEEAIPREFAIEYTCGWVHTSKVALSMVGGEAGQRACEVQIEILAKQADKALSELKATGERGRDAEFDPDVCYRHERTSDLDPETLRAFRAIERTLLIAAPQLDEVPAARLRWLLVEAAALVAPAGRASHSWAAK